MITRIRIGGYKSFADTTATLSPLTVLLGPLGSGRSNFLEALWLLGRTAAVERLERAFALHHRGRAPECLRGTPLLLEADLDLNPRISRALNARLAEREKLEEVAGSFTRVAEKRLRYQLAIELLADSASLRLADEKLQSLSQDGQARKDRKAFFERDESHGRFVARIERQQSQRYFGTGRRRTLLSEVTDLVYHPHPAAAREELLGIRRFAFEPSALRSASGGAPAEGPGLRGEDLFAFLTRLASEESDVLRRVEERLSPVGVERIDVSGAQGALTLTWRGEAMPLALAPDGILRLIALCAALECAAAPTLALLDEPEAGLDRSGIAILARILRNAAGSRRPATQVLVVTTSIELVAHLEPVRALACRREPGRGTVLEVLGGEPDDLFRRAAMERALEGRHPVGESPASVPRRRGGRGSRS